MLEVSAVRAFSDNYIWLIHAPGDRARVAIVDPGDADPVLDTLAAAGLEPHVILATHHHYDHVGGIARLVEQWRMPVSGPAGESIPCRTVTLREGDRVELEDLGLAFDVLDIPGHTSGHIAYAGHGALFCGDTLFSAGCGRLFEGTAAQMHASLAKLAALPSETQVYCAHEYTRDNLRFALAVEPDNRDAAALLTATEQNLRDGQPSLPSTLAIEARVNPFLRCDAPAVRDAAEHHSGRPLSDATAVFAAVRAWKDKF